MKFRTRLPQKDMCSKEANPNHWIYAMLKLDQKLPGIWHHRPLTFGTWNLNARC